MLVPAAIGREQDWPKDIFIEHIAPEPMEEDCDIDNCTLRLNISPADEISLRLWQPSLHVVQDLTLISGSAHWDSNLVHQHPQWLNCWAGSHLSAAKTSLYYSGACLTVALQQGSLGQNLNFWSPFRGAHAEAMLLAPAVPNPVDFQQTYAPCSPIRHG